jgi:ribosomal protein S27AE
MKLPVYTGSLMCVDIYAVHVDQTCNSLKMAGVMFRWGCGKCHVLFGNRVRDESYENIKVMF